MESPTVAGIVGAVVIALLGWLGKSAATVLRDRARRREIETTATATISQAREARPWALMESRIEDLEGALDRVSASNDKLRADNDRLRDERDKARIEATDAAIEMRRRHAEEIQVLRDQLAKVRRRRVDG